MTSKSLYDHPRFAWHVERSGISARHVQHATRIPGGGKWNDAYASIGAELGGGFIIALLGKRGTGKTQLAVNLILEHFIAPALEAGRRRAVYVNAADLFLEIRGTFKKDAAKSEAQILQKYMDADFLVVDEVHQRGHSVFENNILTNILDRRYGAGTRDTLLLANQSTAEFSRTMGPSIISRLHESGRAINCDWPSFRENQRLLPPPPPPPPAPREVV